MWLTNWHFWSTNKEVIVNSLDLASFIFVTPQVMRAIATEDFYKILVGIVVGFGMLFVALYLLCIPIVLVMLLLKQDPPEFMMFLFLSPLALFVGAPIISIICAAIVFTFIWLEPYALALGIAVFFASRIVALTIAIHEVHSANASTGHG